MPKVIDDFSDSGTISTTKPILLAPSKSVSALFLVSLAAFAYVLVVSPA
jgi:hypothetical protein